MYKVNRWAKVVWSRLVNFDTNYYSHDLKSFGDTICWDHTGIFSGGEKKSLKKLLYCRVPFKPEKFNST